MRILLGYLHSTYPVDTRITTEAWLSRLRAAGIMVDGFCLTLKPSEPRLEWKELDSRWKRGDRELLVIYEDLAGLIEGYDVFVNFTGINLHPDFVQQLPTFNVYSFFDDPESSAKFSQPVAWSYDLALVGNVAEVDSYQHWKVKYARLWPLGFRADDYDPRLNREDILTGQRDIDVAIICERVTHWRRERLDRFAAAFPQGAYYGQGWPQGFLPEAERVQLLQRTRIGINIHHSTGPINFRTFYLPANGVMQICDNKADLARLFELGKEVIGFETIEEAIDLCHYYLAHEEERRQIAAAGWERAMRDYNEIQIFRLLQGYVNELMLSKQKYHQDVIAFLYSHRKRTKLRRFIFQLQTPFRKLCLIIRFKLGRLWKNFRISTGAGYE